MTLTHQFHRPSIQLPPISLPISLNRMKVVSCCWSMYPLAHTIIHGSQCCWLCTLALFHDWKAACPLRYVWYHEYNIFHIPSSMSCLIILRFLMLGPSSPMVGANTCFPRVCLSFMVVQWFHRALLLLPPSIFIWPSWSYRGTIATRIGHPYNKFFV
jgi:hypothetical protein